MDDVNIDRYKTTVNLYRHSCKHSAGLTQGTVGHSDLSARYQQPLCAQVVHNDQHTPKGWVFFWPPPSAGTLHWGCNQSDFKEMIEITLRWRESGGESALWVQKKVQQQPTDPCVFKLRSQSFPQLHCETGLEKLVVIGLNVCDGCELMFAFNHTILWQSYFAFPVLNMIIWYIYMPCAYTFMQHVSVTCKLSIIHLRINSIVETFFVRWQFLCISMYFICHIVKLIELF